MRRRERKEFMRDLGIMLVGVTPVSWALSIAQFSYKWGYKRKVPHRAAKKITFLSRKRSFRIKRHSFKGKMGLTAFEVALFMHRLKNFQRKIVGWLRWNLIYH
jgi:hypothetical protein